MINAAVVQFALRLKMRYVEVHGTLRDNVQGT